MKHFAAGLAAGMVAVAGFWSVAVAAPDYVQFDAATLVSSPQSAWARPILFSDEVVAPVAWASKKLDRKLYGELQLKTAKSVWVPDGEIQKFKDVKAGETYSFGGTVDQIRGRYYVIVDEAFGLQTEKDLAGHWESMLDGAGTGTSGAEGTNDPVIQGLLVEAQNRLIQLANEQGVTVQQLVEAKTDGGQRIAELVVADSLQSQLHTSNQTAEQVMIESVVALLQKQAAMEGTADKDEVPMPEVEVSEQSDDATLEWDLEEESPSESAESAQAETSMVPPDAIEALLDANKEQAGKMTADDEGDLVIETGEEEEATVAETPAETKDWWANLEGEIASMPEAGAPEEPPALDLPDVPEADVGELVLPEGDGDMADQIADQEQPAETLDVALVPEAPEEQLVDQPEEQIPEAITSWADMLPEDEGTLALDTPEKPLMGEIPEETVPTPDEAPDVVMPPEGEDVAALNALPEGGSGVVRPMGDGGLTPLVLATPTAAEIEESARLARKQAEAAEREAKRLEKEAAEEAKRLEMERRAAEKEAERLEKEAKRAEKERLEREEEAREEAEKEAKRLAREAEKKAAAERKAREEALEEQQEAAVEAAKQSERLAAARAKADAIQQENERLMAELKARRVAAEKALADAEAASADAVAKAQEEVRAETAKRLAQIEAEAAEKRAALDAEIAMAVQISEEERAASEATLAQIEAQRAAAAEVATRLKEERKATEAAEAQARDVLDKAEEDARAARKAAQRQAKEELAAAERQAQEEREAKKAELARLEEERRAAAREAKAKEKEAKARLESERDEEAARAKRAEKERIAKEQEKARKEAEKADAKARKKAEQEAEEAQKAAKCEEEEAKAAEKAAKAQAKPAANDSDLDELVFW